MTPEAQRIAIAEACGWEYLPGDEPTYGGTYKVALWHHKEKGSRRTDWSGKTTVGLPDYLNDLNAAEPLCQKMHEAGWAVKLTPRYCLWYVYASHKMLGDFEIENTSLATAICEAFLRTLNLWVE